MIFSLKFRRSDGVRVSRKVHGLISRGNAARDAGDHHRAAILYEAAVRVDPGLVHIWIQLGHMRKELADVVSAARAYASAVQLRRSDPSVLAWLYQIAGRVPFAERQRLADILMDKASNVELDRLVPAVRGQDGEVVFDISDLIAYFAKARLPTGIQRVQIEVIRAATEESRRPVRICCAMEGSCDWVEVPAAMFHGVANLATSGGGREDPEWISAINALHLRLILTEPIQFGLQAVLVNLGTSWWLQNYFLQVRNAQSESGIDYIPFVHDFIPILAPEHCVGGLVEDFISWAIGVFDHADRFLVNSNATKSDLLLVADLLGRLVDPDAITVVPLDADYRLPTTEQPLTAADLGGLGLDSDPFVLFVSTIESRKGHLVALRAWRLLIAEHGNKTPRLVCVGNDGWLNEDFYALLQSDPVLAKTVSLLSRISDAQLTLLYSECLFTIYPSFYEGWGLPVTESLSYGKPVVTCANSSLTEAGGIFATYIPSGSVEHLAGAVARLAFDEDILVAERARIKAGFSSRSWAEVSAQILSGVQRRSPPLSGAGAVTSAQAGRWYSLVRNRRRHIWLGAGSAEQFRVGRGWSIPDDQGCWVRNDGARLHCALPAINCEIMLRLICRRSSGWSVFLDGVWMKSGILAIGMDSWIVIPVSNANANATVNIDICAEARELGVADDEEFRIGVAGFLILPDSDEERGAVLEVIRSERLDTINAYTEPCAVARDRRVQ